MKKILVWAYCEENLGDDLFLKVLFDRYNYVEWTILGADKKYEDMFYNVNTINYSNKFSSFIKYFINYNKYDAFILIGGSIFMGIDNWKKGLKDREYMVNRFKKLGKKIFILGSNFGPYDEPEFYDGYKKIFKQCEDICFRDTYSFNLFRNLNNIRVASDIVFQLNTKNVKKEKDTLGISVISLDNRNKLSRYKLAYENKIKEIIEKYASMQNKITLFSFCSKEGDVSEINNIIKLVDKKYLNFIEVVEYKGNIDEFLYKFKSMEKIIAIRFHSLILSQLFEQNVFPIIYSEKTMNTLKDMGLDKHYTYIEDIESLNVDKVVAALSNNKVDVEKYILSSYDHFINLDKYIKCDLC